MRVAILSASLRVFGSRLRVSSCAGSRSKSSGVENEARVVWREGNRCVRVLHVLGVPI